jgi:hypothetical protein
VEISWKKLSLYFKHASSGVARRISMTPSLCADHGNQLSGVWTGPLGPGQDRWIVQGYQHDSGPPWLDVSIHKSFLCSCEYTDRLLERKFLINYVGIVKFTIIRNLIH